MRIEMKHIKVEYRIEGNALVSIECGIMYFLTYLPESERKSLKAAIKFYETKWG